MPEYLIDRGESMIAPVLAVGAVIGVLSTIPFGAAAIGYRHRDNGLAYLLLVLGVGVWNGTLVAQLLSPDPRIKAFFLALTIVGALQSGLGWLLFASTASRTSERLSSRPVYAVIAVLAGIDIVFAVTSPAHSVFWTLDGVPSELSGFAVISPRIGYWLHVGLLTVFFSAGTMLFAGAWRIGRSVRYTRAYTIAGAATVVAIVGSAVIAPGGLSVAPLVTTSLVTVAWVQAKRGRVFESLLAPFHSG